MSKLDELDTSRLFFTGCSMGSALTVWAAQCFHKSTPSAVTAFGTQSTGLKVKGDGLSFPPDNYDPGYKWGECPTCKYFPAPVVKTSGLKACINDQTGDQNFYESSEAHSLGLWLLGGETSVAERRLLVEEPDSQAFGTLLMRRSLDAAGLTSLDATGWPGLT